MSSKHWKDSPLLSANSIQKLTKFTDLILHWNARINLTGLKQASDVEDLLIGESVLAAEALKRADLILPATRVLDFGSGAGIPGLVWSALDLQIQVTSLEIRQKKIAFQKEVVRELGLDARISSGRFPEAVSLEKFDLIVSRAIRYDPKVWDAGGDLLVPNGKFVRFATLGASEPHWKTIPVSDRTSLQVKGI